MQDRLFVNDNINTRVRNMKEYLKKINGDLNNWLKMNKLKINF